MAKPRGKPFEKGKVANPKGRGKGTLNAMTGTVKEIISSIIDNEFQSGRAAEALKSLYEKNETQYLQALDSLSERIVPKLARSENLNLNTPIDKDTSKEELDAIKSKFYSRNWEQKDTKDN